jgi:hypothetical protein
MPPRRRGTTGGSKYLSRFRSLDQLVNSALALVLSFGPSSWLNRVMQVKMERLLHRHRITAFVSSAPAIFVA